MNADVVMPIPFRLPDYPLDVNPRVRRLAQFICYAQGHEWPLDSYERAKLDRRAWELLCERAALKAFDAEEGMEDQSQELQEAVEANVSGEPLEPSPIVDSVFPEGVPNFVGARP